MRNKLIAALSTKFSGVGAKDLGRIADNIMKSKTITTEEEVNSAVEEVTFADVLKSFGDSRAAEATKTAVSNYEKKHGLKDGKPTEQKADDDDPSTDDDKSASEDKDSKANAKNTPKKDAANKGEFSEVMAMLKAMSGEIQALKQGKITETRKTRLGEITKGLTPTQKRAYDRLSLDGYSDDDFNSLCEEITEEVQELIQETKADGTTSSPALGGQHGNGSNGSGKEATDAEIADVLSALSL